MTVINNNKGVYKRKLYKRNEFDNIFDFNDIIAEIKAWDQNTQGLSADERLKSWSQEVNKLDGYYQRQIPQIRRDINYRYEEQQREISRLVDTGQITQVEADRRRYEVSQKQQSMSEEEVDFKRRFDARLQKIGEDIRAGKPIEFNNQDTSPSKVQPAPSSKSDSLKPTSSSNNGKVAGNPGNNTTGKNTNGNNGSVNNVAIQPSNTIPTTPTSPISPNRPNNSNTPIIPTNTPATVDDTSNTKNKSSEIFFGEPSSDRNVPNPDSLDNFNDPYIAEENHTNQNSSTIPLLCIIIIAIVAVACAAVFVIKRRNRARQLRAEFNMKNDYDSNDLEVVTENPQIITESIINEYANDYTQSEDQDCTYNYGDNQPTDAEISPANNAEHSQEEYAFTPQYSIANVSGMENSYYPEGSMQGGGQPLPVSPSSKERELNIDDFIPLIKSK